MDIRSALKRQYFASLSMLRLAIERCPEEVWVSGKPPRSFWRIAYHALYYTHLYLLARVEDFVPWEDDQPDYASLWDDLPESHRPYTPAEVLRYLSRVEAMVEPALDGMDLAAEETGFHWYDMPKLDHQMMNLRHLQGHIGQLSEILMANGVEVDWVGGQRSGR